MDPKDLKFIAQGFINSTRASLGIANQKTEDLATKRYEICLSCDTISESKTKCDESKGGCGCNLSMKTRSNSNCPKSKW